MPAMLVMLACHALAAEPADQPPATETGIDTAQQAVSNSVNEVARWFDAFFYDERYAAEDAYSRIRVSPVLFLEEGKSADTKLKLSARIKLPRFEKKLHLFIAGESDDENDGLASTSAVRPSNNQDNATTVGLQYFVRAKNRLNISFDAGVKRGDNRVVEFFAGPRLRRTWQLDSWQSRFIQRVRWYDQRGWESRTQIDFERVVGRTMLFRVTAQGLYREDKYHDDGYTYDIGPSLIQRLRGSAAIEYQWINNFKTRPKHRLDATVLVVRYRQRIWRPWLFYEVSPQLAFYHDDDFRPTPGIELRLEINFGGPAGLGRTTLPEN